MAMKFLIFLLVIEAGIVLGKPAIQDEGKIQKKEDALVEERVLKQGSCVNLKALSSLER